MSYPLVRDLLALTAPDRIEPYLAALSAEQRFELATFFRDSPERSGTFSGSGTAGYWEEPYRIADVTYDRTLSLLRAMGERLEPYPLDSPLVAHVVSIETLRRGLLSVRLRIIEGAFAPRIVIAASNGRRGRIVRERFLPPPERASACAVMIRMLDRDPFEAGDSVVRVDEIGG